MNKLSKQSFDDLIKSRFDGFEQNPPDYLQSKIKQSINNKFPLGNNLSKIILNNKWLFTGIVIAIVGSIIIFTLSKPQTKNINILSENSDLLNSTIHNVYNETDNDEIIQNEKVTKSSNEILNSNNNIIINSTLVEDNEIADEEYSGIETEEKINLNTKAGSNQTVCGLECQLNASLSHEKVIGTWSYNGPGNLSFSKINEPNAKIKASKFGVYKLTWTEKYNDLQANDNIVIEFLKSGDITITPDVIDETCHNKNGSIEIYVNGGDGNYNYYWGDEISPGDSYKSNLSAGNYSVKVVDGNNCQALASVSVNDKGIVSASFIHKELTLSVEVPIYFVNTTKIDGISFKNTNSATFFWNFDDGSSSEINEPEHIYNTAGTYSIKMYATSKEGCKDSSICVVVIDNEDVRYANIFTPNGDGNNDVFYANSKYLDDFKCVIINRTGKVIYEWNDPEKGWDGKLLDGSDAKEDTYIYLITGKDQKGKPYNYQSFFLLSR